MAHFAIVDTNNIVTQVLVIEQDVVDTGLFGNPSYFIKTSYNTRGGVHYGEDGQPDGGVPFRKNFAGVGYRYDNQRDAFIAPQPFPSWILNEETCLWEAPYPMPETPNSMIHEGKIYEWDELTLSWIEVLIE